MLGSKNGFHSILSQKSPIFTTIHCAAHRVNLSASDVFSSIQEFCYVENVLAEIYNFYTTSSKRDN